jgi:hypothetical protein
MDDGLNDGGAMEFAQRGAQEQQEQEGSMLNIYQRMAAVMNDVSYVQKEDKKVNNQYTFVSHDAVTAKIRPALLKHGIMPVVSVKDHTQDGNRTEATIMVRFVNVDQPEDAIEVESFGYGIDPQDKGPGKAVSYAFKYALLKVFCLETGDDPERDSIEYQAPPKPTFDPNATFGYIANATTERALKNLYRQAGEQGATAHQLALVADACAARKAILLGSQA